MYNITQQYPNTNEITKLNLYVTPNFHSDFTISNSQHEFCHMMADASNCTCNVSFNSQNLTTEVSYQHYSVYSV